MGSEATAYALQHEPWVCLNPAAQKGPQQFDWWPDWRGKYCAIVACGPSANKSDVALLRNRLKVIAIKEACVELAPWADVVYGCDWPWWRHRRGMVDFKGLRIGFDPRIAQTFPGVRQVVIEDRFSEKLMTETPMSIGAGGNSGFQALNLAVQFGVKGVLLIGFDMQGEHFYGRNNWGQANNPSESNFKRWVVAFQKTVPALNELGVTVLNASLQSAMGCFRKTSVRDALQEWGC